MSTFDRRTDPFQRRSWEVAKYALTSNRVALIEALNHLVGPPTPAVLVIQTEFLTGRMEPLEMINFAWSCHKLILSFQPENALPDTPKD